MSITSKYPCLTGRAEHAYHLAADAMLGDGMRASCNACDGLVMPDTLDAAGYCRECAGADCRP